MGWRDVLSESQYEWDMGIIGGAQPAWALYRELDPENAALYETCANCHAAALLTMPAPDRIALARELLAGTGRVVSWEMGKRDRDAQAAWNAARTAMLEDTK